ncbi:hypothetical protein CK203_094744 [Vitis vinifera]|uniref:Ty3 transposon capsid-like protein domain-containing protein n=1 Tax=Vitis vinifera TaxID=29760 RepID=A0A438EUJ9_VITVI|nr:hypothetical protein CK203_094744 [Vitis vinifera]
MPRKVHTTLHYGGRHERNPKLSREFQRNPPRFQRVPLVPINSQHGGKTSQGGASHGRHPRRGGLDRARHEALEDLREQIQDLREGVLGSQVQPVSHEEFMAFQDKVMSMFASVKSRVEVLAVRMEARDQEIRQELAIYKIAVSTQIMATHEAPRVKVPKPHTFSGKRDAKELDNFLWHMERYFEAIALTDEATKVCTTTFYLTDNATLWWRRRFADIEKGMCTIDTWDAFKREIKRQFYPEDVAYLARKSIKRLKHMGLIHEYVKEFSTLILKIPNMSEKELLFNFIDNLQSWAEQELRRRGVQDLAMAMAGSRCYTSKEGSNKGFSGKDGKGKDKRKEFMPRTNCFLCDGPHWARDCPKRKALNAMIEEKEKGGDAQALVNGKATKAIVYTGATHNFVSEDEAKRLELQASKEGGWLKAVNSVAKPSHGVVRGGDYAHRLMGRKSRLHSGTHGRLQDGTRDGLPTEG